MNSQDPTVYYVYGMYLHRSGDLESAAENYKTSLAMYEANAEVHYNLGLLYLDSGDLDQAAEHARRAYELGYPLPGLRRKLSENGIQIS